MDKIPFVEGRIIDELVEFWETSQEPRDLATHIERLSIMWGDRMDTSFFEKVYKDLCTNRRKRYANFSAPKFKGFLEEGYRHMYAEYQAQVQARVRTQGQVDPEVEARANLLRRVRAQINAERQAKENAERQARARADFDALGKQMMNTTTRNDLVALGRKRADLAQHTGIAYVYINHCWHCSRHISSDIHAQCPGCKYYICSSCGSCFCPSP